MTLSADITSLNAALEGRYLFEREVGEGGAVEIAWSAEFLDKGDYGG